MRILLIVLAVLLGLVIVLLVAGAIARARLRARYPAPGRLVDVGGRRFHVRCEGSGSPTVVFEGGLGPEAPVLWDLVLPRVAELARACAYDRAGYGWSDPGPDPRTAAVMVEELRSLLRAAEIPGPYVFVAHSFGAIVSRLFAATHTTQVAGMVLLDGAHEDQMARFPKEALEAVDVKKMEKAMGLMARILATGIPALAYRRIPMAAEAPEPLATTARALVASRPGMATTVAEQRALEDSQDQLRRVDTDLGELPLVVIRHGRAAPLPSHPSITPEVERRYEESWQELQAELAATSRNGELLVATESGHGIPVEQPDLVVDAIRRVVEAARARTTAG